MWKKIFFLSFAIHGNIFGKSSRSSLECALQKSAILFPFHCSKLRVIKSLTHNYKDFQCNIITHDLRTIKLKQKKRNIYTVLPSRPFKTVVVIFRTARHDASVNIIYTSPFTAPWNLAWVLNHFKCAILPWCSMMNKV